MKKKHSEFFDSKINESEPAYKPSSKKIHTENYSEKCKTKEKEEIPKKSHKKKEIDFVSEEKKAKGHNRDNLEEKRIKKKNSRERELYEFESESKKKPIRGPDIIQLTPKSFEKTSNPAKEKEKLNEKKITPLKPLPLPSSAKKKDSIPKEEKKGKQKKTNDNLSLDDFIKQIENNLDLHNFSNQANTYQKELNHFNESIQENSFIEELKDDGSRQPSKSKKSTKMEIETQKDLLQENINLIKNFKKELKHKDRDRSQDKSQKAQKNLENPEPTQITQKFHENKDERPQNPEKGDKSEENDKNDKHERSEPNEKNENNEKIDKFTSEPRIESNKGLCLKSAPEPIFEKTVGLEMREDEKKKNGGKKKNLSLEEFLKSIGRTPDEKKYRLKDFPNEKDEKVLNERLSKIYRRFKKV